MRYTDRREQAVTTKAALTVQKQGFLSGAEKSRDNAECKYSRFIQRIVHAVLHERIKVSIDTSRVMLEVGTS